MIFLEEKYILRFLNKKASIWYKLYPLYIFFIMALVYGMKAMGQVILASILTFILAAIVYYCQYKLRHSEPCS